MTPYGANRGQCVKLIRFLKVKSYFPASDGLISFPVTSRCYATLVAAVIKANETYCIQYIMICSYTKIDPENFLYESIFFIHNLLGDTYGKLLTYG